MRVGGVRLGILPVGTRFRLAPDDAAVYFVVVLAREGNPRVRAEVLMSPRLLTDKGAAGRTEEFSSRLTVYPEEEGER